MFENRAKPAFTWGKLQSLQTDFLKGLKPAYFFFKGVHIPLGPQCVRQPIKCIQNPPQPIKCI